MNNHDDAYSVIVTPCLSSIGGVASIWSEIRDECALKNIFQLSADSGIRSRCRDLFYFLGKKNRSKVLLNTSLMRKSLLRDWVLSMFCDQYSIYWHGWDKTIMSSIIYRVVLKRYLAKSQNSFVLARNIEIDIKELCPNARVKLVSTCSPTRQYVRNITKPAKRILFCSRLEKAKGIYELIEIVRRQSDCELHICGDGNELRGVKMRVKSLRNVHFHGRVAGVEKHRLFSLCNVSCLPTYYPEGLPVSLLEGSSYGHYIISTKNAGIVDHFDKPDMGVFLDQHDWQGLEQAIADLSTESIKRAAEFNPKHHALNWTPTKLYEQLQLCKE